MGIQQRCRRLIPVRGARGDISGRQEHGAVELLRALLATAPAPLRVLDRLASARGYGHDIRSPGLTLGGSGPAGSVVLVALVSSRTTEEGTPSPPRGVATTTAIARPNTMSQCSRWHRDTA